MAFVELTKDEKNPKLAVQVNNSLKYQDKDGNLQDRKKITALIDIVKEAGSVSNMNKGAVTLSLTTNDKDKDGKHIYKNYFVNKNDKDDIVLVPTDKNLQSDKNSFIYFNKKVDINNPDKYFYSMSKAGTSEQTVENIKINETEKSAYLGARVTLKNDEIKDLLFDKEFDTNQRHTAIIGKDKLEILSNAELQARREAKSQQQTQSKEIPVEIQDKNGNVVEKTTTPNAKAKDGEEKKKAFKPQSKSKSKEQDIER